MKLYNSQVARDIRAIKPPYRDFKMDIIEYPGMLSVRVYEENINQFSPMEHISIMEYLHMIKNIIESHNIPCDLEGVSDERK
jgi:hypothetical protein